MAAVHRFFSPLGFLSRNWAPILALLAAYPLGLLLSNSEIINGYYQNLLAVMGLNIILGVSLQFINGISGQFSLGHAGFASVGAFLAAYPALQHSSQYTTPGPVLLFYVALAVTVLFISLIVLMMAWLLRLCGRLHRSAPLLLLLVAVVWFVADISVAFRTDGQVKWLFWSRLMGWISATFQWIMLHGNSLAGGLTALLPESIRPTATFVILLVGGGACAAVAGFMVGLPTLRLRGDYLAVATLGFGEIIRVVLYNSEAMGGALGLIGIPVYTRLDPLLDTNLCWIIAVAIITVLVIWRLSESSIGRSLRAVAVDDIAASAMGVNVTQYKIFAFVVGAFLAGVAGAIYALHEGAIDSKSFNFIRSIELVVIVVLAGNGSISGTILSAIILTLIPELLRDLKKYLPTSEDSFNPDLLRMVIYSLAIILLMIFRPQGLLGTRELWPRRSPKPGDVNA